jgi:thiol:disulfide interchange protein DsbC
MMIKPLVNAGLLMLAVVMFNSAVAGPAANEAIEKALQQVLPDVTPDQISPSPVKGVSEVLIGSRVFYVTNDGRYLFQGNLIDLKTRTDVSEDRRKQIRLDALNHIDEAKMVIFPAKESRHTVTVFTDVDCTYCRKLHREIDQYNDRGITVRYLMYPRSGVNTPSYYKAVSVLCDSDRQKALTRAKAGEQLERRECDNPIKEHMQLGTVMGLKGTPAIIMDDGELLPGYIPADKLAKALDAGT